MPWRELYPYLYIIGTKPFEHQAIKLKINVFSIYTVNISILIEGNF